MKVLITGCAGFIGAQFAVDAVLKWGWKVIGIDAITYCGDMTRLSTIVDHPNFTFVKGDVCDAATVEPLFDGVRQVYHFAAETHVDRSLLNSDIFFKTNAEGTRNLLSIASRHPLDKFIHVSTDEVYGSHSEGFFKETDSTNPTNPYSVSKLAAELLAINAYRFDQVPIVISRGSNTYGPYQYPEKVIPLFISKALMGSELPLYGDGRQIRDWLHVEDHVSALACIGERGAIGQVYNIPGSGEIENIDLAKKILTVLDKPMTLIKFVEDRKGHDRRYGLNGDKLSQLGWLQQKRFENDFDQTIRWYCDNEAWLKNIQERSAEYAKYLQMQYGTNR